MRISKVITTPLFLKFGILSNDNTLIKNKVVFLMSLIDKKTNQFMVSVQLGLLAILGVLFVNISFGQNKAYVAGTTVYTFTGTGNFTGIPAGTTMKIECWGGGGGGGGVSVSSSGGVADGGGGGGGAYAFINSYTFVAGGNLAVTVGASGSAGSNSGGNGGNGGNSLVGSIVQANGGAGGIGSTSGIKTGGSGGTVAIGSGYPGGKGGDGKTGSWDYGGGGGGAGGSTSVGGAGGQPTAGIKGTGSANSGNGGAGGSKPTSDDNTITPKPGQNGSIYGGGGGGAAAYRWAGTNGFNSAKAVGGNGAPGYVIITIVTPTNTITTSTISGSPFCAGTSVSVPYTITGTFTAGNVFTAQLSNASGSFATPTNIGTLSSTAAGTISATIPSGATAGTGYRIRVVSSAPAVTGTDNGANLVILAANGTTISSGISLSAISICAGQSVTATRQGSIGTGRDVWWMKTQGSATWDIFEGVYDVTFVTQVLTTPGVYEIYHHPLDVCAGWNGWALGRLVSVTVNATPSAPTATSSQSFCGSGTVSNLVATGTAIKWYAASSGGSALAGGTALVSGNTYYATQTVSGCESVRTAVAVTINNTPTISVQPIPIAICETGSGVYSVTATGSPSYEWQFFDGTPWQTVANVGITAGLSTMTLTNPPVGYSGIPIRCVATNGCGSVVSNEVILSIVNNTATVPTSITTCIDGTLTAQGGSGDYVWSKGSCDGFYLQNWNTFTYSATNATKISHNNGIVRLKPTAVDYGSGPVADPMIDMSSLGSFDPLVYRYINIRYRVASGTANGTEIFFYNTSYPGASGAAQVSAGMISDQNWHVLTIDMYTHPLYKTGGNITGWRYDWATNLGTEVELDYIALTQFPIASSITVLPTTTATEYFVQTIGNCGTTVSTCISTSVIAGPATTVSIPHERTDFSSQAVTGWSSKYTTPVASNPTHDCKGLPTVFTAVGQYSWVQYDSDATRISYSLKINNPPAARTVILEESADGCTWTTVATHTNVGSTDLLTQYYTQTINTASRHIRFRMTVRAGGRIEVDNIKIYKNSTSYPTALSADNQTQTCAVYGNHWVHFYAPDNTLIASVNADATNLLTNAPFSSNDLGEVTLTSYVGSPGTMFACNGSVLGSNPLFETAYMGRNWVISSTKVPSSSVSIRLPFVDGEMTALTGKASTTSANLSDDVANSGGLFLSKFSGTVENSIPQDNCGAGTTILIQQTNNGVVSSIPEFASVSNAQYVTFKVSSFSELYLHGSTNNSPLPVTLTNFSASCESDDVKLFWTTASEQNSDRFIVEKSRDGETWSFVAEQDAAGNSTTLVKYIQEDNNNWNGTAYYRLRQLDFNGAEEIFGPISVTCEGNENGMTVHPNPNTGSFRVEVTSTEKIDGAQLQIFDITGKLIISQIVNLLEGNNQIYFNHTNFQQGSYFLKLNDGTNRVRPIKMTVY